MIKDQLLVNLLPEATEDSDTFRNECLYTEACDSVLQVRGRTIGSKKQARAIIRLYILVTLTRKILPKYVVPDM